MGQVVLLQASPSNPATGAAVQVRLAGGGSLPYAGSLGFTDWRSGLKGLPRFTTELGFDETGWTGGALPQTAVVEFQGTDTGLMSNLAGLYWKGSRVVVSSGDDTFGPPPSWQIEMTGTIADASIVDGVLQITMSDLSGDLAKPIVPDTFAGTGGVEGGDDAIGRIKRRSWGRVFNIEGRLIDGANNVYEFGDPARPLQSFDMLKDKGRAGPMTVLAWQGSIAATFQALQTATATRGGGVVAPSIAMVKWWTVPAGPITADMRGETLNGYAETPTDITARIVATRSTVNPVLALYASRNYPAGIHCDDASETVAQVLDRLLLGVSLVWALSPAGQISISEWTWTGPVETLVSQEVSRQTVFAPLLARKLGYQKNQRQQDDSEIAAVLSEDGTYPDGTPYDAVQPAEAGADVTGNHTSANTDAVGYKTSFELLGDIQDNITSLANLLGKYGVAIDLINQVGFIQGQTAGNFAQHLDIKFSDQLSAIQGFVDLIASKSPDGTAAILSSDLVIANADGTEAKSLKEISAQSAKANLDAQLLIDTFIAPDGTGIAKGFFQVKDGSTVAGIDLAAGGSLSTIDFLASVIRFTDPNNGGTPITPFYYADGILYLDNVYAKKLTVEGVANTFDLQMDANGFSITIPGGLIIKGGRIRQNITGEQTFQVPFPVSFPSTCLVAIPIGFIATANNLKDLFPQQQGEPTKDGFAIYTQATSGNAQSLDGITWLAIGF
jgi:hypothetical protein